MAKRLFIGLELPESCKAALRDLDPGLKDLRWLPAEQLHLTMSFLGEIDDAHHEPLRTALAGVRVPPFFLPLAGVGSFNARGRPSVVWVGVGEGHPHLSALHHHIHDAVLHAGLEPDLKPFRPHVTVARSRGISRQALQPFLRRNAESEIGLWKVTGFTLYSSVLTSEGATHMVEAQFDL